MDNDSESKMVSKPIKRKQFENLSLLSSLLGRKV